MAYGLCEPVEDHLLDLAVGKVLLKVTFPAFPAPRVVRRAALVPRDCVFLDRLLRAPGVWFEVWGLWSLSDQ